MKQSKSVKYIKANTLMSEMEQTRIKSTNLDYLNKLTKLDLLVIDDFGLMDLDLDKCWDLFEDLDTRDGRKSTVVISQFPVSTWFDMFADNTYADACLTRITDKHHTYRLEMSVFFSQNTSYNREIQISPVPISGSAIPVMIPFEYPQIGYLNLTISPNLYRSWM